MKSPFLTIISTVLQFGVLFTASIVEAHPDIYSDLFQSGIVVDRIDLEGITSVVPEQVIENALEVVPGEKLERQKVIQTEENLQAIYQSHGYREVSIRSKLSRKKGDRNYLETVLEFEIHQGRPSRIASIRLNPLGELDEPTRKNWERLERRLTTSLKINVGDIFDQEKIGEGKRAIQEVLAADEYIGARVEQVGFSKTEPPVNASLFGHPKETAQWLNIELGIGLGDRVSFGFKGNTVFTRGYLDALIDEQRLLGLGKDYIGVIRSKIEDEYHSAGYARVEISNYSIESPEKSERRVVYVIKEGPRVRIDSIDFDGNTIFTDDQLRDRFFSKASGLVQRKIYVEKDVQKAAELLIEWLKEKGYLAAKLVTINSFYPPKPKTQIANSSVRLLIYLYEGDQTIVQNLTIEGLTVFSPPEIERLLRVKLDHHLNLFAFSEGIENLKKAYRDQGYLNVRILNEGTDGVVQYTQENRFASIHLQLDEGPRYLLSRIEVEGLVVTQKKTVLNELKFEKGSVLTESQIVESERQLKRLGIFSSVVIRPVDDPEHPGSKLVRVSVHEAERGILTGGPGYRNDLGFRAFGQFAYTNLWGLNHTLAVTTNVNRRLGAGDPGTTNVFSYNAYHFVEVQSQLAYAWPSFGVRGLTFRPTFNAGLTQYIDFAAQTLNISMAWDKVLSPKPNIVASFAYNFETIGQFNALVVSNNQKIRIGSAITKISLDLRDDPLNPSSGLYTTASFDLAHPMLGSQDNSIDSYPIGYYRFLYRADYYQPIWKGITWYTSFRTGYEASFDFVRESQYFQSRGIDSIPLIKQFMLGGIGSLRGYQELELNKGNSIINTSLAYVNYRNQLELPLSQTLRFALFFDAANLVVDRFSFGELDYGAGFGVHYQTPVGAVNLDWGFKVNPPPNTPYPYVIHFSVGVI